MKWLISLLCLAASAGAGPSDAIRQCVLDPLTIVRVPVARDRLTTIRFPGPVSDIEGAFVSPESDPPSLFQISFRPGSPFFSLRALATNASAALTVGWKGRSYVLELVESSVPLLAIQFIERPSAARAMVPRIATPARLREMLKAAKFHSYLEAQQPLALTGIERLTVNRRQTRPDFDIVLEEIFRFDSDDTLVFHVTFINKTLSPIYYLPGALAVKVGECRFDQSASDAEGVIPACEHSSAFFAISAGVRGTPANLSIKNEFQVMLGPINLTVAGPCPATQPNPPSLKPTPPSQDESPRPPH
jgi:hypothetical protein